MAVTGRRYLRHRPVDCAILFSFTRLDPPYQPVGAEDHLLLRECIPWAMVWPKTQIRLSPATPQTTPQVRLGQNPIKASTPAPPQMKEPVAWEDDISDDFYIDDDH